MNIRDEIIEAEMQAKRNNRGKIPDYIIIHNNRLPEMNDFKNFQLIDYSQKEEKVRGMRIIWTYSVDENEIICVYK